MKELTEHDWEVLRRIAGGLLYWAEDLACECCTTSKVTIDREEIELLKKLAK